MAGSGLRVIKKICNSCSFWLVAGVLLCRKLCFYFLIEFIDWWQFLGFWIYCTRLLYLVIANPEAFLGAFSTVSSWQVERVPFDFITLDYFKTSAFLYWVEITDCPSTLGRLRRAGCGSSVDFPSYPRLDLPVALQLQCCSLTSHRFFHPLTMLVSRHV